MFSIPSERNHVREFFRIDAAAVRYAMIRGMILVENEELLSKRGA